MPRTPGRWDPELELCVRIGDPSRSPEVTPGIPMSRFEQDTIKRQIRQLGGVVAAILARSRAEQDYESGLEAIREAAATGLGPDRALLERLDPESATMLLREADRALVYAQVCVAEAELLEGLGRDAEAAELRRRAGLVESATSTLPGQG